MPPQVFPGRDFQKKISSIFLLLLIFISGLILWGLMLFLTWDVQNPNSLMIDLGKTGASLSLISVIGGLVQFILKNRETEKQREKEILIFYKAILSDFKSVYDMVEKARLLIEAHRTAKTYGEQLRGLIDGVVILHNVKRGLNPGFPDLEMALKPYINSMNQFIKGLLSEYRDNYKRISILQEIDELKKEVYEKELAKSAENETQDFDIPADAWNQIKALEKLSILIDDEKFEEYRSSFLTHLDKASAIIRTRIPIEEK